MKDFIYDVGRIILPFWIAWVIAGVLVKYEVINPVFAMAGLLICGLIELIYTFISSFYEDEEAE